MQQNRKTVKVMWGEVKKYTHKVFLHLGNIGEGKRGIGILPNR